MNQEDYNKARVLEAFDVLFNQHDLPRPSGTGHPTISSTAQ